MIEQPVHIEVLPEDLDPIPPLIAEAQEVFRLELPQLLKEHSRQWVAYRGRTRVRLSRSKNDLYDQLLREGYNRGELLVRRIEPGNLSTSQAVDVSPVILR